MNPDEVKDVFDVVNDGMIALAKHQTQQYREQNGDGLSEKARATKELVYSGGFGCYADKVANLVSLITGEKIAGNTDVPHFCMLVHNESDEIGCTATSVFTGSSSNPVRVVVREDGHYVGQCWDKDKTRPATDEEIEAFFSHNLARFMYEAQTPGTEEEVQDTMGE